MKVVDLPIWERLKPYAYCEPCTSQPKKDGVRYRRKLDKDTPKELVEEMLQVKINCCTCGQEATAFRVSTHGPGYDIATSCELRKNPACNRTWKPGAGKMYSTIECERIEESLGHREHSFDPRQEELPI